MQVVRKNTTKLCATKPVVTVNGKFPGPTLYAREDDTVTVRVINHVQYNVTIHWYSDFFASSSFFSKHYYEKLSTRCLSVCLNRLSL